MAEKIILNKNTAQLKKEKANTLVAKIAYNPRFKSRCHCCGTIQHGRGMLFHHVKYKDGEKTHKDFKGDRLGYYQYLEPKIKQRPTYFMYLCTPCHGYISKLRRIKDNNRIKKICDAAIKTEFISPRRNK